MTTPLTLSTRSDTEGGAVLSVSGEIDMNNSEQFDVAVRDALEAHEGRVMIDLSDVRYLDSAGLNVLFQHADRIEVVASELVAPVLVLTGLPELAPVSTAADGGRRRVPDAGAE